MRPGGGKPKGGAFERLTCKALSEWLSDGKRDDLFWRSAMSGGRASVQFKKGTRNLTQMGDISAVDPWGAWLIERFIVDCKNYNNLDFMSGLLLGTGRLFKFWHHLKSISMEQERAPMLIAKQDFKPTMLITDNRGVEMMGLGGAKGHLIALVPSWGAYIYDFDIMSHLPSPCPKGYPARATRERLRLRRRITRA